MSLSWCCCNSSEECQFTFLECHFITFISMLLYPCQTSQGSVQFKFPLPHKSHKLTCWYSFCPCVSVPPVCQIIIQFLHPQSYCRKRHKPKIISPNRKLQQLRQIQPIPVNSARPCNFVQSPQFFLKSGQSSWRPVSNTNHSDPLHKWHTCTSV